MPGKYDIEGYGTYEIDSDDDAEIQSTISEIIAHEKAARASRPTLGGPTGLASQRLDALTGGATEEPASAPAAPGYKESAFPVTAQPAAPARPRPVPKPEPEGPSVLDAVLTPELQAARKRFAAARLSGSNVPNQPADASAQRLRSGGLDVFAQPKPPDEPYDPRQEGVHRVGDFLTAAGAAAREAIGGFGDISPDASPIQRARLRRPEGLNLAGGGVRKYEPPTKDEPYLPEGAGVRQYRPTADRAAERLAALQRGDDGTIRREGAQPLFAGKALGEAPATTRLNPEDTLRAKLEGTAPVKMLENDYTKAHDWMQGASDDFGHWLTEDTQHSALARLIDAGENSDSAMAQVVAAGTKGIAQAGASSAPALAEFALLHRATPGALKPLADAAMVSWFGGEGAGQALEALPHAASDIGSAIGGAPVPFDEMAQHLGQLGMGAFMGATPLGAKSPIAKSIEGNRFLDPGLASGRSPEQARLYGEATRGQADREMASRAISVEEGTPMIGAFNRQPMTAPLTSMAGDAWDFLSNRQQPAVEALRRPRQRGGLWQDAGLRSPHDTMTAPAEPEASFTGPIDVFDLAAGRRPTPYAPEMGPETWEGIVPRLAPFEPPVGPPVPYSARERLANAQLLEGQGPPDLSRAERAMHSIPSGPEGQVRGPFPVPPDVLAQGRTPPADLQARTGNAPRPAAPVDPEAARVLASILSGGEEPPPAPTLPARPPLPTVGDVPSWQDRQRAERASPAKPPAEENIQVEPKATTDAQLEMVEEGQGQPGKKPGVLYTVQGGAKPPDVVPEGLARVDGPAGTLIFDPTKVTPEQAREALTSGEGLDKALGFSGPRPEPHPDNAVVSVLGKDGVEKSSQVVGPGDIEGAVKAAQGMAGEGDQVAVRTPDEVIADRQAGIEAEKKPPVERRVEDKGPEGRLHFVDPGQVVEEYRAKQRARVLDAMDKREEEVRNAGREQANADERAHIAERIAAEHALAGDQGARRGGLPAGDERDAGPSPAPARVEAPEPGPGPEAPRAPEPELPPAAEVVPGARKGLLDERARSIEERRELQRKIREDDLGPKKLARAKEELKETELHLQALDKKLGYEAGGPTAAQVEADLRERFGDRYEPEAPKLVEAAPGEAPSAEPQAATDTPPRGPRFVGNKGKAALQPNEHVRFRYELRDASDVITSHDDMLVEDPRFDRGDNLQPRDRERDASREQIEKIEKAPDPLIMGASPTVQIGAPWLEPAGDRVAVGNGRTIAHRRAYRKGSPAAERYRQMLRDDAENYGFTKEDVDALPHPMLVRVPLDPMTPEQLGRFADYGNRTDELRMSPAERSQADARRISPATMAKFEPGDNGDLNVASNDAFRARWVSEVLTQAERAEYLSADGRTLLPGGIQRMQESVVAKGYGSPTLVEKLLEGGGGADGLTKTAITGLMRASSTVGKTRMMVEGGEAHKIDFTAPITEALTKYAELRKAGTSIGDFLDQGDMFGDPMSPEARQVLSVLEANKRSAKGLGNYISAVARALENAGDPRTELVGAKPTISDIYGAARIEYEERHGAQGGLFGRAEPVSPSVPSAGGEGGDGGFDFGPDEGGPGGGAPGGTGPDGGGGGAPGGGTGGKPRVFAYSSSGQGVGRDPYAERVGKHAVPVPTFERLPRTPPVRPPEGPLEVLKAENLVPAYARVTDGVRELGEDIHEVFSAVSVDDSAKRFSGIHRKSKAQADFRLSRLEQATRPLRRMFDRLKPKDRMAATVDFFQTGEERRKQPTPELEKQWHLFHAITEASWREIEQYGHDGVAGYLTDVDYVPRHFKKPEAAAKFAHEWYERRSIEGDKGFLKKRFHEFLRDALESGLQLEYDNPADALKANIASVQHYLGWQKVKGDLIRSRIIRYEPISDMADRSDGYDVIHPTKGVVFGDAAVQVGEAVTKRFVALEKLLDKLGIQHDRLAGVGGEFGRAEYGGEAGAGKIVSRLGSPVGVVAHELGHILDQRYGLQDALLKSVDAGAAIRRELGTLADMRFESNPTISQGYKDYVRSGGEKIANFLDAFVAEPTLARAVAPVTLGEFRKFLLDKPELHEFFDMSPGLELEERVTRIPINGKVIAGHWIAPRAVVKLIDRSLTPGLQNKIVYRSFRNLTNAMNQVQLGFSMFHPIFTGLDSVQSTVALSVQQAMEAMKPENAGKGFGADALKSAGRALVAPVLLVKEGAKIRKMARNLPIGMPFEQMPEVIQNHLRSGGSFWQDSHYSTGQIDAFRRSLDRANPFGAALHLPGAIFEAAAWPVMEWWVPNIKAGLFAQEAAFELKRLGPDATGAEIDYHLGRIQDSVENRAGQLRYDNLLWNRTMKDLGQVVFRSLGWNLGGVREVGGGIFDAVRTSIRYKANAEVAVAKGAARLAIEQAKKDLSAVRQGGGRPAEIEKAEAALRTAEAAMPSNLNDQTITRRMVYAATLPITVGAMGGLYYWMKHGKPPTNVKDMFAIPTGGRNKDGSEERVFLPTYAKDEYAWAKDPFATFLHKLSPGLSVVKDIARNEDYFGTQVREGNLAEQTRDSLEHAIRQMVPMSVRQYMNSRFPGSEIGLGEASLGITKAPASLSQSDAEEALNEYLRRTSGGVKTKEEAAKSKARSEIKALIRGGHDEAADAAIEKAIAEGQVSADDAHGRKALYKAAAKTVLENTLRSMPVDEALEVYRAATPEERQRWADAFRGRIFGSASRRPSWWKDKTEEQVEAIQAEAEKLLPPE